MSNVSESVGCDVSTGNAVSVSVRMKEAKQKEVDDTTLIEGSSQDILIHSQPGLLSPLAPDRSGTSPLGMHQNLSLLL